MATRPPNILRRNDSMNKVRCIESDCLKKRNSKNNEKSQYDVVHRNSRVSVILDTDIGGDIDDTWALGMLVNLSAYNIKMVSTVSYDAVYRTKIVAKFLQTINRTDIPVGIGTSKSDQTGAQRDWVEGYDLEKYPGIVHKDAVGAMAEIIDSAADPITILCIGTFRNIAELFRRYPGIESKIRIVAMCGSVYQNIQGENTPIPEWNIVEDISAAQAVFRKKPSITIAPVDVCRSVRLEGEEYALVRDSKLPIPQMILEQYRNWTRCHPELGGCPQQYSSTLWDTVAIHLGLSTDFLEMETLNIRIDDQGYMRIDNTSGPVHCALRWSDLAAFKKYLVKTLTASKTLPVRSSAS